MRCQFCGHDPGPDARSCARCGAPVSARVGAGPAAAPPLSLAPTHTAAPTESLVLPPRRPAASPAPGPGARPDHRLAGLGTRLGGALLDGLLLTGLQLVALFVLTLVLPKVLAQPTVLATCSAVVVVVSWLYFAILNGRGATFGKRLVGSRVVGVATGRPIGFGRGLLRTLVYWLECLPAGLGLLSVVNPERRAWHDRAAGSVVTWTPAPPRRPRGL